ncbi:MAG: transcription-repair coupling factor [Kiritimatiellae bacterium]|nr:transcription-repair coupling factor [Kiritimatiellia bacterium]MDW8458060.1 transcription-repair coupling factor [Verrucomicrobiota bacterium]
MEFALPERDVQRWAEFFRLGGTFRALIPPGAAPAWLAWALHERFQRLIVAVADGPRTLDRLFRDLQTFGGNRPGVLFYYPPWESLPGHGAPPHADLIGDRFATLRALSSPRPPAVIATCVQALMLRTVPPASLREAADELKIGQRISLADFLRALAALGYEFAPEVASKGQASLRGGILDLWPPVSEWPARVELFGEVIDSIRAFDPADQKSKFPLESVRLAPAVERPEHMQSSFFEHLPPDASLLWVDVESIDHHAALYDEMVRECGAQTIALSHAEARARAAPFATIELALAESAAGRAERLGFQPFDGAPNLSAATAPDQIERERVRVVGELNARARRGERIRLFFSTDGARRRFMETYGGQLEPPEAFELREGGLSEGFAIPDARLLILGEEDFYGRRKEWRGRYDPHARRRGPRRAAGERIAEWSDLQPGDYVVHADHGIGKYLGLFDVEIAGRRQEALVVEYADRAKLYLPVSQAHLLTRYVGAGRARPELHALGGKRWAREKAAAQKAVEDLAAQLLETQAKRDVLPGFAFGPDTPWQHEFEAAFPYEETEDQERAIRDVKRDMESPRPMDRLVCGDVGYGKTEVAMRAAFKAVMAGKQVAVLVPTTVLAQQHFDTFSARMAAYPVRIEMLSRFQTRSQQAEIVRRIADGSVDIVIGTHRLLQGDVSFKDLGLVIVDEEQRFGVAHKEFFKRTHTMVDVLTLTATPIPRTLYMSLSGAKDLSTIETPPQERLPVETIIVEHSDEVVREAILREINREGQAFYLHNRVHSIERVREWLERLVPEARIDIAHGRMPEDELAAIMRAFARGDFDVLLCTTIIESGLDLPNVNTILIERSDRFGLAELYQLRGRVGRYKRKAYAYFLLPRHGQLLHDARRRLQAIRRYSHLGAGFRLAMRDLEIRGAGNLLGPQQSGHIAAVGFELYCQLLRRTISALKGEAPPPVVECDLKLDFIDLSPSSPDGDRAAALPASLIEDESQRIRVYRQIASAATVDELDAVQRDVADRFGRLPPAAQRVFQLARLRIVASRKGIRSIEVEGDKVMMAFGPDLWLMPGGRFPRLRAATTDGKLQELLAMARAARKKDIQ